MKTKAPLPWFGSDSAAASNLANLLPKHIKHVAIPFAGGLSILPHLTQKAIVANDLNHQAINFYNTLKSPELNKELISLCEDTLSHPAHIQDATEATKSSNPVRRAWGFWASLWLGRKGDGGTRSKTPKETSVRWTASGGNNATRLQAVIGDLKAWANLFKQCEFTCLDFRDFIAKCKDRTDNAIYCDPPWVTEGHRYQHRFSEQDHCDLADMLDRFQNATIIVRYGESDLINQLYRRGWGRIQTTTRNQANKEVTENWYLKGQGPRQWARGEGINHHP